MPLLDVSLPRASLAFRGRVSVCVGSLVDSKNQELHRKALQGHKLGGNALVPVALPQGERPADGVSRRPGLGLQPRDVRARGTWGGRGE